MTTELKRLRKQAQRRIARAKRRFPSASKERQERIRIASAEIVAIEIVLGMVSAS